MSNERFEFSSYKYSKGACTEQEYWEYTQEEKRRQNLVQKEYEERLEKMENCSHISTVQVSHMYWAANKCTDCGKIV